MKVDGIMVMISVGYLSKDVYFIYRQRTRQRTLLQVHITFSLGTFCMQQP